MEAAAWSERQRSILALMPVGLAPNLEAAWRDLAKTFADDPPGWSPSPRYRVLINEYCIETARIADYRTQLKSINLEVYREKSATAERVKVHPFVPLLDAALKRQRALFALLDMTPASRRKLFDG
jgi:phage terminase small subunit